MSKGFLPIIPLTFCIILALIFMSGCVGTPVKLVNSTPSVDPVMGQFDADLANGPVFIEFGAPWCDWCAKEKPVVDNLTREYPGVKFYSIDTDNGGDLVKAFYVSGIPQMNVIAGKNADGSYRYVDAEGRVTADREKSSIIGYTETDQLKHVLDVALGSRK